MAFPTNFYDATEGLVHFFRGFFPEKREIPDLCIFTMANLLCIFTIPKIIAQICGLQDSFEKIQFRCFQIRKNMYNRYSNVNCIDLPRGDKTMFLILGGGLLIIIIAVIAAVIPSVVSAVAADQDIED